MAQTVTAAERRGRALDRGAFLAGRAERVAEAAWTVPSQSGGETHVVALVGGYLRCDCYASLAGHPCAHKAAVALTVLAGPVRAQAAAPVLATATGGGR